MASLKAGVAGFFAVLHAREESFVGFLQAKQDILQDMRSNVLVLWPEHCLDLHQITLLFVDADRVFFGELPARRLIIIVRMPFHACLIGIAALLQTSIVEFAAAVEYSVQFVCRGFVCVNSVFVGFYAHDCRFLVRGKRVSIRPFPMLTDLFFYASCKTVTGSGSVSCSLAGEGLSAAHRDPT